MCEAIYLDFFKPPSQMYTIFQAFQNRKAGLNEKLKPGGIIAKTGKLAIDPDHLAAFEQICEISQNHNLNILYPFTLVYPYMLRMLTHKKIPLSLFGTLNTRCTIRQHRPITSEIEYTVACCSAGLRAVEKGMELDIHTKMFGEQGLLWENMVTYFYRKPVDLSRQVEPVPRIETISDAQILSHWYLAAKDRLRFAKICGDTNPIHYIRPYAKMSGFERDFSQPIRVVAKCMDELGIDPSHDPVRLDLFMKGPVYYENQLVLKISPAKELSRFDLYCGTNERPCICGELSVPE